MHIRSVKIICFLLIPVMSMEPENRGIDEIMDPARSGRFGFGGFQTLHNIWSAFCEKTCPVLNRPRFLGSPHLICALKCPTTTSAEPSTSTTTASSTTPSSTTPSSTTTSSTTPSSTTTSSTTPSSTTTSTTTQSTSSSSTSTTASSTTSSTTTATPPTAAPNPVPSNTTNNNDNTPTGGGGAPGRTSAHIIVDVQESANSRNAKSSKN